MHDNANFDTSYHDIKNGIQVQLSHHESGVASINIPYRKGMQAYVDGQPAKIQKVNYMMTGVPVDKNAKQIVIKYQPPYWNTMIFISLMSMILSAIFVKF